MANLNRSAAAAERTASYWSQVLDNILHFLSADFAVSAAIDLVGMCLLVFAMYYRRYHDKELVTAAAQFNVFIFCVLSTLSSVEFGVNAGFGLFAILALFTLRSEPLTKIEMTYFFGSVAIAVICSVQSESPLFAAAVVGLLLLGTFIIDHPRVLRSMGGAKITLDRIDQALFADPTSVRNDLSKQLGVDVVSYQVLQLDYINELVRLNVFFRTR